VKRGEYEEELEDSPIAEQAAWESVEKGSPLWLERQALHWKLEIERMFSGWDTSLDLSIEQKDLKREWMLRHLEIPFIRYPRSDERCRSLMDLPDNQEAIQEMVVKNPLLKGQKWKDLWLDRIHPERVT
jgi:hypothetical protein